VGKETTVEMLGIIQRRENSRAGNYVSGPKIPSQGRNFRPWTKFPREFPALRNSAKSLTERCGAMCSKGAGNSGLAEFLGAGNFIISGPQKFG
jgi:hypothetical protein